METQTPPPPTSVPRKSRRLLRRFLIGLLLVLGLLLLALVIVAAFFDEQITRRLVSEINKNLKTELVVGDANLSLLSGFPKASVNFSKVRLKDAMGGQLLVAEQLAFRFDLFSLFGSDIKIHTLRLRDATVRVVVNRAEKTNTDIFKESKTPTKPSTENQLRLALENAEFLNIAILYDNAPARQTLEMVVDKANFAGNFSAQQFRLTSQADLKILRLDSDSSRYLAGENLRYDAALAVDLKKGAYGIQRLELTLGGNTFDVNGLAVTKPDYTDLNLRLVSQEGDISMIANLLPDAYHEYFSTFQSTGNYACSGAVKGKLGKTHRPNLSFEVSLRNGKVSSEKLQSPLRNVSFQARYNARPDGSGEFEVADFKGDFGGQPLGFSLKINNLNDPVVDFRANGALPLDAAYGIFDSPEISSGDGTIRLNRLQVQGRYADMTSMSRIAQVNATGEIQFDNAQLVYNKIPLNASTGFFRLQGNELRLDSIQLRVGNSDFAFDGMARNLLPALFADSLNSRDALLEFATTMRCQNLDVTQLLQMFSVQETAAQVGSQQTLDSLREQKNAERTLGFDKLKGTFDAQIAHFQYGKIEGQNFQGRFAFDHNTLTIKGKTNAMRGSLALDGSAQFDFAPTLQMRITARELDLNTLMAQCENFGQTVITDANLRGLLSGRIAIWAYWDEASNFQMNRLRALADVQGRDGELLNLKMLEDFSTFVHIQDLRRVKFSELQNHLEISNQRLYIPAMLIQSNALNLTLSGEHTFNNDIDYKIKVNAGQTLLNRLKKHDPDLDPLPAQKGWFNLFYTIVGNLDKYDMKRGKKAVKAEFERSEARKQRISTQLNTAFSSQSSPISPTDDSDTEEYLDEIKAGG
jgi:hypothetical protein